MSKLPLAVDIADAVNSATSGDQPLDIATKAEELTASHPEADTTADEVAEILETETATKPAS